MCVLMADVTLSYQVSTALSISPGVELFRGRLLLNLFLSSSLKESKLAWARFRLGGVGESIGLVDILNIMGVKSLVVIGP